ncbi:hypothetical protein OGAPHI_007411 [Ogataea philodendri]|uniref:Uncharacterized protein n=1 Tax=Ogataea philodendri TaxID=1378263 RepID=A0A9P8NVY4_9ASCO|nr:uncharacterized protein OGAPHI_007411 [Ogataea philodendri]KAH3660206.1 hypothetical protein OGAPHI_007411 [Ogataea philodendri]
MNFCASSALWYTRALTPWPIQSFNALNTLMLSKTVLENGSSSYSSSSTSKSPDSLSKNCNCNCFNASNSMLNNEKNPKTLTLRSKTCFIFGASLNQLKMNDSNAPASIRVCTHTFGFTTSPEITTPSKEILKLSDECIVSSKDSFSRIVCTKRPQYGATDDLSSVSTKVDANSSAA